MGIRICGGGFSIYIRSAKDYILGEKVYCRFHIAQHSKDIDDPPYNNLELTAKSCCFYLFAKKILGIVYNILLSNYSKLCVVPIKMYSNADTEKVNIFKDNKNKCGVYRWINLETNKSYVGSSVNLRRRFNTYYSFSYLTRNKSLISKALLKYGYSRFRLEILEYCDPSVLMEREQYYIDLLKPEYNILKIAGSLLGFKHSDSTRERLSKFYTGRVISPEVRDKLSNSQKGRVHT